MYLEHVGEARCVSKKTGYVAVLDFKAAGRGNKNKHVVEGYIYRNEDDSKAKKNENLRLMKFYGTWSESFTVWQMKDGKVLEETAKQIWKGN